MIRVLRILNRFNLGGPTYNVTFLSAYLPDEYETLLCGGKHEPNEGDSVFICEAHGVKPLIIHSLQRSINPIKDYKARKEIQKIIQEFKPHIVHTHASKAGALGRSAAFKENVPIIVHTFHGHVFHSYFGKIKTAFYKFTERRLAKKTDAIIAISTKQKHELCEIHHIAPSDKVHVVELGFDLNKFNPDKQTKETIRKEFRAKYKIQSDEIAIGVIGRLTAIKNHDLFINAIEALVANSSKKIKAIIIGDGERMPELKSMVYEKNMNETFVFTSWIKDVENALPGLDILALTSFNEGTPVSLIEAQAAGVPILTTDVGGVKDIMLDNETGYILKSFLPSELAEKLSVLADNEELREKMSQKGWNFVQQKFHYSRLCFDVDKLYKELLIKKGINEKA